MKHQELEQLLSRKEPATPRENTALVLAPHIQRNAARLRKRRRDRIQAVLCALAGILFLALAGGILYILKISENPEALIRRFMYIGLGGMAMTLLLAPVLAWYSEKEG